MLDFVFIDSTWVNYRGEWLVTKGVYPNTPSSWRSGRTYIRGSGPNTVLGIL